MGVSLVQVLVYVIVLSFFNMCRLNCYFLNFMWCKQLYMYENCRNMLVICNLFINYKLQDCKKFCVIFLLYFFFWIFSFFLYFEVDFKIIVCMFCKFEFYRVQSCFVDCLD